MQIRDHRLNKIQGLLLNINKKSLGHKHYGISSQTFLLRDIGNVNIA